MRSFVARRYDKNGIDIRCAACVVLFVWGIFSGKGGGVGDTLTEEGKAGGLTEIGSERAPTDGKGRGDDNGKRRKQEFR